MEWGGGNDAKFYILPSHNLSLSAFYSAFIRAHSALQCNFYEDRTLPLMMIAEVR